jgi:hypothetical protein
MASLIESPQVTFVSKSKLPASLPFSLSRLVLPILCVSVGVSVGFATGFTLALVTAPNEIVAASSGATQVSPAPLAASFSQPATDTIHSIARTAVGHLSSANPRVKTHAQTTVHIALNKTPDAVKPAIFRLGGKEWRVARPIAIPVAQPVRQGLASTPAAASNAMPAQRS